jgi:hypothetical protein
LKFSQGSPPCIRHQILVGYITTFIQHYQANSSLLACGLAFSAKLQSVVAPDGVQNCVIFPVFAAIALPVDNKSLPLVVDANIPN